MHIVIDARIRRSSTGRYTHRLIEYLQLLDKDNQYTILVQPDDTWEMHNKNFMTVPCGFKQFSFNPLDQITFSWQLYRLKPDLVHFTMTQQPIFYFGNIVTTTHDLTMLEFVRAGRLPKWLHAIRMVAYRFLFWWGHRKSKKIIVPTNYVKDDLIKHYPYTKDKITVTYESAEPPLDVDAERPQNVSKPFIFHVGSPFPHKNIDGLIKAFEQLSHKHPELQLVLPGKIEFYFNELIEKTESNPAADRIIFPGFVSEAELMWLYQNAEVYVLPSLSEGFGLPGLEAIMHGCPVVSSNATCLPEVYGDAVQYFDPRDIDDMAQAINNVIGNKKLKEKLIKKGYKQAEKYSWSRMAAQTLEVYLSF